MMIDHDRMWRLRMDRSPRHRPLHSKTESKHMMARLEKMVSAETWTGGRTARDLELFDRDPGVRSGEQGYFR